MDEKIKKIYVPMTETGFYILLCLQEEMHGYGIVQKISELTDGYLTLGPGTIYGTLSKMEKDGLIRFTSEKDNKKFYIITELGLKLLNYEKERIKQLYYTVRADDIWNQKR